MAIYLRVGLDPYGYLPAENIHRIYENSNKIKERRVFCIFASSINMCLFNMH